LFSACAIANSSRNLQPAIVALFAANRKARDAARNPWRFGDQGRL
jgi:hypothetical protein